MSWEAVSIFVVMGLAAITGVSNMISYFLKKKDMSIDSDHEKVSQIANSIVELREHDLRIESIVKSIKTSVENQDERIDKIEKDVRNVIEALNRIEIFHNKQHNENMGLSNIIRP